MAVNILYAGSETGRDRWCQTLQEAAAESQTQPVIYDHPTQIDPAEVDYLVFAPNGPTLNLNAFSRLKAIQSVWAGVEDIMARPDLPADIPVLRMVEPGLRIGMTDYVVTHVMRAHLGLDAQLASSRSGQWQPKPPRLSCYRQVGVMGLGALGRDAAEKLAMLGFQTRGWSRTRKNIDGVTCFSDLSELHDFVDNLDILVLLLPSTAETAGLVNLSLLEKLADKAHLINAARSALLPEADLLAALDAPAGLSGATLDVFDQEPLPEDHIFWSRQDITITPHIASVTRPQTAAKVVLEQIDRCERGEAPLYQVDREKGY